MNLPIPQHGGRVSSAVQQLINTVIKLVALLLGWQLDSIADIAAFATVDDTRIPDGSQKLVRTLWDTFTLDKTSVEVVDGITVVATMSGTGRWLRDLQPNTIWGNQATWYVDAVAGSDEANGATAGTALATFAEARRRIEPVGVRVAMTINILTDLPAGDPVGMSCDGAQLTIEGTPTTVFTGTVNTYTRNVATNVVGTLNNAAWTVADHVGRHLRFTSGAAAGMGAYVLEDLGGGDARLNTIVEEIYPAPPFVFPTTASPGGGDSFVVETLPVVTFEALTYGGQLRIGKLESANAIDSVDSSVTLLVVKASWVISSTNANLGNCYGYIQQQSGFMYLFGGALSGLATFSTTWVQTEPTLDADVAIASGTILQDASIFVLQSDIWFFGNFGNEIVATFDNATFGAGSFILRGTATATRLLQMYAGSEFISDDTTVHTITEQTIRLGDVGNVSIELDTQTPFIDPHTGTLIGIETNAGSGAIGPIKAGVKGALTNVDGTTYALSDLTSSGTNVVPHVATNRGLIRNLRAHLGTQIGADNVQVNVLVDSGSGYAATGITLALTGATVNASDITNAFLVNPGDRIAFQLVRTGGGTTGGADLSLSLECG